MLTQVIGYRQLYRCRYRTMCNATRYVHDTSTWNYLPGAAQRWYVVLVYCCTRCSSTRIIVAPGSTYHVPQVSIFDDTYYPWYHVTISLHIFLPSIHTVCADTYRSPGVGLAL